MIGEVNRITNDLVSNVLRAGAMVGGPTMAPSAKPATTSTPTQASQPVVQRLASSLQPARADTHHGTLLLGVGIGVAIAFSVFILSGRSS